MPGGVQGYDRFAYTNNNPVLSGDPSGHCPPGLSILCGALIGAAVGAGVSYGRQVITNISQNGWSTSAFTQVDGNDIIASAAVGAAAGALIGSGVGAGAGIGLVASSAGYGMAASAAGYTLAAGKEYNTYAMVGSAVIGGASGAVGGAVSNALAGPLPLNYGGILNDSGKWLAEMGAKSLMNGVASGAQTLWTNTATGQTTTPAQLGASVLFGATTGPVAAIAAPGVSESARSFGTEYINNLMEKAVPERRSSIAY